MTLHVYGFSFAHAYLNERSLRGKRENRCKETIEWNALREEGIMWRKWGQNSYYLSYIFIVYVYNSYSSTLLLSDTCTQSHMLYDICTHKNTYACILFICVCGSGYQMSECSGVCISSNRVKCIFINVQHISRNVTFIIYTSSIWQRSDL